MIAIFGLDGTLALNEHRQHFLEEKPKNWKAFEEACVDDKPNLSLCNLWNTLANPDNGDAECYIFTGRSDDVRDKTIVWLDANLGEWNWDIYLSMRKSRDFRDDCIVKKEMFEALWNNLVMFNKIYNEDKYKQRFIIFDDRQKVVDMWREMGIVCCQVAPGNF